VERNIDGSPRGGAPLKPPEQCMERSRFAQLLDQQAPLLQCCYNTFGRLMVVGNRCGLALPIADPHEHVAACVAGPMCDVKRVAQRQLGDVVSEAHRSDVASGAKETQACTTHKQR